MLILALDTTSEKGGVAIFRDAECVVLVPNEESSNQYAIALFELVEQALGKAGLTLSDIELYAAAKGPGSFTGIRVGLAAARAWGKVFHRAVRGVSVLEAMVNKASPATDWAFPVMDARRGEFFLASFRRMPADSSGAPQQKFEAADEGWIFKPDTLRAFLDEKLAGGSGTCVYRAHDLSAAALPANLPTSLQWLPIEGTLMDAVAAVARREEQLSLPAPEANLDAYYLRRPDAEVKRTG